MKKRMVLLYALYILTVCAVAVIILSKMPVAYNVEPIREFLVTVRIIKYPQEKDVERVKTSYKVVSNYLSKAVIDETEINELHKEVLSAKVCSKANKSFNKLAEKYEEYETSLGQIKKQIEKFEKEHNRYLELLEAIPSYVPRVYEPEKEKYDAIILPMYQEIDSIKQSYLDDEENIKSIYEECKKIADDFFELYIDEMSHIVNAEAGITPAIEQCYVANVIENRIESSRFPNTLHGVIFDSGQYEPTWTGTYYNTPSNAVIRNVTEYLRGRVETEMPSNVLFQSRGIQGPIWKHMSSGHYFCYG